MGGTAHRVYSVTVFIVLASLDNVTISLVPPLYSPISRAVGVGEGHIGVVTAVTFLVTAVAAVGWAYAGDRTNRKRVLMLGTVVWSLGAGFTATAGTYPVFFAAQMIAAIGLGAVASVGFSVVSDLITPRRRGLVMSLWGLSQGVGTLAGTLVGGQLGASDWRRPFELLAVLGVVATVAYFFTYNIRRGQSEPELAEVFAAGAEYEHRISRADLPGILRRRSNIWLILQGLTAQTTFGSLVWLPRLFQARAEAQGFDEARDQDRRAAGHAVPAGRGAVDRRRPDRRPLAAPRPGRPGEVGRDRDSRRSAVLRRAVLRAAATCPRADARVWG